MSDAKFPNGIIFKTARAGVPEFIKGHLSFKVDEAVIFLKEYVVDGWVNLDIKKSKTGKYYLQLNEWKAKKQVDELPLPPTPDPDEPEDVKEDSPF